MTLRGDRTIALSAVAAAARSTAFDNVPQAAWGGYRLTTIEQNLDLMTEAAVSILIDQLSNGDDTVRHIVTPVRMIERGTISKGGDRAAATTAGSATVRSPQRVKRKASGSP